MSIYFDPLNKLPIGVLPELNKPFFSLNQEARAALLQPLSERIPRKQFKLKEKGSHRDVQTFLKLEKTSFESKINSIRNQPHNSSLMSPKFLKSHCSSEDILTTIHNNSNQILKSINYDSYFAMGILKGRESIPIDMTANRLNQVSDSSTQKKNAFRRPLSTCDLDFEGNSGNQSQMRDKIERKDSKTRNQSTHSNVASPAIAQNKKNFQMPNQNKFEGAITKIPQLLEIPPLRTKQVIKRHFIKRNKLNEEVTLKSQANKREVESNELQKQVLMQRQLDVTKVAKPQQQIKMTGNLINFKLQYQQYQNELKQVSQQSNYDLQPKRQRIVSEDLTIIVKKSNSLQTKENGILPKDSVEPDSGFKTQHSVSPSKNLKSQDFSSKQSKLYYNLNQQYISEKLQHPQQRYQDVERELDQNQIASQQEEEEEEDFQQQQLQMIESLQIRNEGEYLQSNEDEELLSIFSQDKQTKTSQQKFNTKKYDSLKENYSNQNGMEETVQAEELSQKVYTEYPIRELSSSKVNSPKQFKIKLKESLANCKEKTAPKNQQPTLRQFNSQKKTKNERQDTKENDGAEENEGQDDQNISYQSVLPSLQIQEQQAFSASQEQFMLLKDYINQEREKINMQKSSVYSLQGYYDKNEKCDHQIESMNQIDEQKDGNEINIIDEDAKFSTSAQNNDLNQIMNNKVKYYYHQHCTDKQSSRNLANTDNSRSGKMSTAVGSSEGQLNGNIDDKDDELIQQARKIIFRRTDSLQQQNQNQGNQFTIKQELQEKPEQDPQLTQSQYQQQESQQSPQSQQQSQQISCQQSFSPAKQPIFKQVSNQQQMSSSIKIPLLNLPTLQTDEGSSNNSPQKRPKVQKNVPDFSSKCWAVLLGDSGELLYGKNQTFPVEIASLTKIMTCWVTIRFFEDNQLNYDSVFIEVSKAATKTIGTSAGLEKGDLITVKELLYGLMLPSGNDAAITLSEGIGVLIYLKQKQSKLQASSATEDDPYFIDVELKQQAGGITSCQNIFLREMNRIAISLGLEKTRYACVHGLPNKNNVSTAKDVGLLSSIAMKNSLFRQIVATQDYRTKKALDSEHKASGQYEWENTNMMLEEKGYDGLKTGITDSAGPCLSSSYQCIRNGQNLRLLCVLLNCKSIDHRWTETKQVISWTLKRFFPKPKIIESPSPSPAI